MWKFHTGGSWARALAPPHGIPTTESAFIEWQSIIHRTPPTPKVLGQKAKINNYGDSNKPLIPLWFLHYITFPIKLMPFVGHWNPGSNFGFFLNQGSSKSFACLLACTQQSSDSTLCASPAEQPDSCNDCHHRNVPTAVSGPLITSPIYINATESKYLSFLCISFDPSLFFVRDHWLHRPLFIPVPGPIQSVDKYRVTTNMTDK